MTNEIKFENCGAGMAVAWVNVGRDRVCLTAWRTVGDRYSNRARKTDWEIRANIYKADGSENVKLSMMARETTRKAAAAELVNEIAHMIEGGHF